MPEPKSDPPNVIKRTPIPVPKFIPKDSSKENPKIDPVTGRPRKITPIRPPVLPSSSSTTTKATSSAPSSSSKPAATPKVTPILPPVISTSASPAAATPKATTKTPKVTPILPPIIPRATSSATPKSTPIRSPVISTAASSTVAATPKIPRSTPIRPPVFSPSTAATTPKASPKTIASTSSRATTKNTPILPPVISSTASSNTAATPKTTSSVPSSSSKATPALGSTQPPPSSSNTANHSRNKAKAGESKSSTTQSKQEEAAIKEKASRPSKKKNQVTTNAVQATAAEKRPFSSAEAKIDGGLEPTPKKRKITSSPRVPQKEAPKKDTLTPSKDPPKRPPPSNVAKPAPKTVRKPPAERSEIEAAEAVGKSKKKKVTVTRAVEEKTVKETGEHSRAINGRGKAAEELSEAGGFHRLPREVEIDAFPQTSSFNVLIHTAGSSATPAAFSNSSVPITSITQIPATPPAHQASGSFYGSSALSNGKTVMPDRQEESGAGLEMVPESPLGSPTVLALLPPVSSTLPKPLPDAPSPSPEPSASDRNRWSRSPILPTLLPEPPSFSQGQPQISARTRKKQRPPSSAQPQFPARKHNATARSQPPTESPPEATTTSGGTWPGIINLLWNRLPTFRSTTEQPSSKPVTATPTTALPSPSCESPIKNQLGVALTTPAAPPADDFSTSHSSSSSPIATPHDASPKAISPAVPAPLSSSGLTPPPTLHIVFKTQILSTSSLPLPTESIISVLGAYRTQTSALISAQLHHLQHEQQSDKASTASLQRLLPDGTAPAASTEFIKLLLSSVDEAVGEMGDEVWFVFTNDGEVTALTGVYAHAEMAEKAVAAKVRELGGRVLDRGYRLGCCYGVVELEGGRGLRNVFTKKVGVE